MYGLTFGISMEVILGMLLSCILRKKEIDLFLFYRVLNINRESMNFGYIWLQFDSYATLFAVLVNTINCVIKMSASLLEIRFTITIYKLKII